ncbi:hypothetical protein HRbin39_01007 [bacterium HR39]|nr:hypothetical protein HRbin39_01007 [bacterium HR39]
MVAVRIVHLDSLRERLRAALGRDSLLAVRLDRALAARDAEAVAEAMRQLALHPEPVRRAVEEEVLAWLFDGVADGESPRTAEQVLPARN